MEFTSFKLGKVVLVILFIIFEFSCKAQDFISISGKILDFDSKEPLPFASIYLEGESIGTTSSLDGSFIFHIPSSLGSQPVIISMIGYETVKKLPANFKKDETILLKTSVLELDAVIVTAGKPLTAKKIVKLAYEAIPGNYSSEPYVLEGFVRDLQKEGDKYVELLEYSAKFWYSGYKSFPRVELNEVRTSFEVEKHPWNKSQERQNSIIDLLEDDFIRYGFRFLKGKGGWNYEIESVLSFNNGSVYKIIASNPPFQTAVLHIDVETYAFVRIELNRSKDDGVYYKRRFTNGMQESSYTMVFEFQKIGDKLYLKYQKEEDTWDIFEGLESDKIIFTKNPKKELFINSVITVDLQSYEFNANFNSNQSIEKQAKEYNPRFWEHYNAPAQTVQDSKILKELKEASIKID